MSKKILIFYLCNDPDMGKQNKNLSNLEQDSTGKRIFLPGFQPPQPPHSAANKAHVYRDSGGGIIRRQMPIRPIRLIRPITKRAKQVCERRQHTANSTQPTKRAKQVCEQQQYTANDAHCKFCKKLSTSGKEPIIYGGCFCVFCVQPRVFPIFSGFFPAAARIFRVRCSKLADISAIFRRQIQKSGKTVPCRPQCSD